MDLGMPFAQREAWSNLKKAVDEYAGISGNEIAVVTSYLSTSSPQAVDNALVISGNSLAMHGHGDLLRRVRESLDLIKKRTVSQSSAQSVGNGWGSSSSMQIPIKQQPGQGEQTHYNQAVARSLCSSFRSLKLDQRANSEYMSEINSASVIGHPELPAANSSPVHGIRRGSKHGGRKKLHRVLNGDKGDSLELDENLLFDEPSYGTSGDENEDDDDYGDSDDDSTDVSENSFGRHGHFPPMRFIHRPPPVVPADPNEFASSLPVNINIHWGQRQDGAPRFRDNQGPHPPLHHPQQQAQNHLNQSSRPIRRSLQHDTPNPETMMASMQALARSVTDDSALIFGERPRPRLNTGESRAMVRPRR